ncbi:MAG: carboxylating nicotinate-nucleotide diphosphorylase [gamma proteobacterium symbiont of Bathyaustriella thionipta]|nr:carboxylating nicotinate-nucleotide diphosphorylase [gamma proteobacterium symbiont of Bathyaustriella thionipta]
MKRLSTAGITDTVRQALLEDIGAGDLTAELVPPHAVSEGQLICRQSAVICGRPWFDEVFRQLDDSIQVEWQVTEGQSVAADSLLCTLRGNSRALLSGERSALNFLQTLSATASLTRRYVEAVAQTQAHILDTRKTLPGLRLAQKYAVRCAGGHNHRSGLYDAILIKENHIAAAGSIRQALGAARSIDEQIPIEIEVENLEQLQIALNEGARHMLLDNFNPQQLRQAVRLTQGRARLEASGNVCLDSVQDIAATGVDDISIGELTKNISAIDLSLRFSEGRG